MISTRCAGTPSASSDQAKPALSGKGISGGAIAGVVIGVVAGAALVCAAIALLARYILTKQRAGSGFSDMSKELSPGAEKLNQ